MILTHELIVAIKSALATEESMTNYLKNKNYSIDKLIDVGLTNDNGNDIFINRIMFPIYDLSGNPVAFSGRIYNTKDTAKVVGCPIPTAESKPMYNFPLFLNLLLTNS